MSRKNQLTHIKSHREALIKDLEEVYMKYFDKLTSLNLNERDIAKLTQVMLDSREEAIKPLSKNIEDPLITHSPLQP